MWSTALRTLRENYDSSRPASFKESTPAQLSAAVVVAILAVYELTLLY